MSCAKCGGNCASCGGCGALELSEGEIGVLLELGSVPFWPILRKADTEAPVCPEMDTQDREQLGRILLCLEKKGLVGLDWDLPLKGYDYGKTPGYPVRGSMALTLRGQQVLDILEIQGIDG